MVNIGLSRRLSTRATSVSPPPVRSSMCPHSFSRVRVERASTRGQAWNEPLCIDLFCGYGGWARGFLDVGYRVIGFDNEPKCAKRYPGEFVLADAHNLDGQRFRGARVIVASPPCTEFSNVTEMAVARGQRGPREPYGPRGMDLMHEASRIIYEAEPD